MASFLYFVEGGEAPATRDRIEGWGIAHAFESVPYNAQVDGRNSPTGKIGIILADQARLGSLQVLNREGIQVWRRMVRPREADGPLVMVGRYNDEPILPADLARDVMIDGLSIELGDGNAWQVPVVRHITPKGESIAAVPCYLDVDEFGEAIRGEVIEKHQALTAKCVEFFDVWCSAWLSLEDKVESFSLDWDSPVLDAMYVLGANYRIGPTEQAMLKLFREDAAMPASIMEIACDCIAARLYCKKKTPIDSLCSGDGQAA